MTKKLNESLNPIEHEEAIKILFDIVAKYDGYHDGRVVRKSMKHSVQFKKLVEYIDRHYIVRRDKDERE
jgi:hypothetical protein